MMGGTKKIPRRFQKTAMIARIKGMEHGLTGSLRGKKGIRQKNIRMAAANANIPWWSALDPANSPINAW